jgi:hypothetical protein
MHRHFRRKCGRLAGVQALHAFSGEREGGLSISKPTPQWS